MYHTRDDEQRWERICNRAGDLLDKHPDWTTEKAEKVATVEVDLADSVMASDGYDDGSVA